MTTKISTIYDSIRNAMSTLLVGKLEIPNPYSLGDNAIQYLRNGWGVTIGDGSLSGMQVFCYDNEARIFGVILTKEVYRLETDNSALINESKSLMEDIRAIKNDMLASDQIGTSSTIQRIDFVSSTGINFINAGKFNLIYAGITFSIEYSERLLGS